VRRDYLTPRSRRMRARPLQRCREHTRFPAAIPEPHVVGGWLTVQLSRAFSPVEGKTYQFDAGEPCQRCTSLKRRVAGLLEELDEQRGRHDLEVREFQRERLAHEAESRELVAELAEYVDLLDSS